MDKIRGVAGGGPGAVDGPGPMSLILPILAGVGSAISPRIGQGMQALMSGIHMFQGARQDARRRGRLAQALQGVQSNPYLPEGMAQMLQQISSAPELAPLALNFAGSAMVPHGQVLNMPGKPPQYFERQGRTQRLSDIIAPEDYAKGQEAQLGTDVTRFKALHEPQYEQDIKKQDRAFKQQEEMQTRRENFWWDKNKEAVERQESKGEEKEKGSAWTAYKQYTTGMQGKLADIRRRESRAMEALTNPFAVGAFRHQNPHLKDVPDAMLREHMKKDIAQTFGDEYHKVFGEWDATGGILADKYGFKDVDINSIKQKYLMGRGQVKVDESGTVSPPSESSHNEGFKPSYFNPRR